MTYLADLELEVNARPPMKGWRSLVEERGAAILAYSGRPSIETFTSFLGRSAGFWMRSDTWLQDPDGTELIHQAIARGKNCIVQLQLGSEELADFLARYGIAPTHLRVTALTEDVHPHVVRITRAQFPEAFRNAQLFEGVDEVTPLGPVVLTCSGTATPALVASPDGFRLLDRTRDRFTTSPMERTIIATSRLAPEAGTVVVLGGEQLHDPYRGATGVDFPGIDRNERFARNLLGLILQA